MPDSIAPQDPPIVRDQIIAALRDLQQRGTFPTARELASEIGVPHTTVRRYIDALQHDGVVSMRDVPSHRVRKEIVLADPPRSAARPPEPPTPSGEAQS